MSDQLARCPACRATVLTGFHHVARVPTNSCLLLEDLDDVDALPEGELDVVLCETCGFIFNRTFDPALTEYSARYEETQAYSVRFETWARQLASRWVQDHDLVGRTAIEIGCGKGEFLEYMVDAGLAGGVGIDPGVHPERRRATGIEWIADFFTADHGPITQDAVICRHTLEHIQPVEEFLLDIRHAIGDRPDVPVLFEVPDVIRALREGAFWDLYYEHCSYFSPGSLVRLFRRCGFVVDSVTLDYDGQYILLEARPAVGGVTDERASRPLQLEEDLPALRRMVRQFASACESRLAESRAAVREVAAAGGRAVLWGAGSKGVSYLGAIDDAVPIAYAVDINPYKHGRYVAGAGQQIVAPAFLQEYLPELVIAMNPVYVDEISLMLRDLGVGARLVAI